MHSHGPSRLVKEVSGDQYSGDNPYPHTMGGIAACGDNLVVIAGNGDLQVWNRSTWQIERTLLGPPRSCLQGDEGFGAIFVKDLRPWGDHCMALCGHELIVSECYDKYESDGDSDAEELDMGVRIYTFTADGAVGKKSPISSSRF